jgi:hypothetical protein
MTHKTLNAEPIFAPHLATGSNLHENYERFRDLSLNLAMMVTQLTEQCKAHTG